MLSSLVTSIPSPSPPRPRSSTPSFIDVIGVRFHTEDEDGNVDGTQTQQQQQIEEQDDDGDQVVAIIQPISHRQQRTSPPTSPQSIPPQEHHENHIDTVVNGVKTVTLTESRPIHSKSHPHLHPLPSSHPLHTPHPHPHPHDPLHDKSHPPEIKKSDDSPTLPFLITSPPHMDVGTVIIPSTPTLDGVSLSSSSDSSLHVMPSHTHTHTRHVSEKPIPTPIHPHLALQPKSHSHHELIPPHTIKPKLSLSLSPHPIIIPHAPHDEDDLDSQSHSFSSHSSLNTPSVSHKPRILIRSDIRHGDDDEMSVLAPIFKFQIPHVVFKIFDCMDLCELLPLARINHVFCSHLNPLSSVLSTSTSQSQSISSTSTPWRTIPSFYAQPSVISKTPALTSISSKPTSIHQHPIQPHTHRISHAHQAHIYDGDDESQVSSANALSSLSNVVSSSPVNIRVSTTNTHTFVPTSRPPPSPSSFSSAATRQARTSHNQAAPLSSTAPSSTSTSLPISPLYLSLSCIRRSYLSHRTEATLRHLPSLSSALLLFPCLHKLSTLNFLTPARFHVSDAILSLLSACPRLQHLDMSDCMRISDDGIKTLSNCHALQTLNLSYSRISSSGLAYLSSCSRLKKLNLKYCDLINDTGLKYLAQLPQLEVINLSYCHRITSAGLASICHCAKLKKINLSRCTRITDSGLRFASMCTQLEVIDLTACESLTGSGLEYLRNCPRLWKVDLSFCTQITDVGLLFLAHTNINCLSLQGCKRITDTGMSYLGEMSELRTLRLDGCQLITDAGIRCLAACTHLRVLDAYDTPSVTILGMKKLHNSFKNHSRTVCINR